MGGREGKGEGKSGEFQQISVEASMRLYVVAIGFDKYKAVACVQRGRRRLCATVRESRTWNQFRGRRRRGDEIRITQRKETGPE